MATAGVVKKILIDLQPDNSLLDSDFNGYKLSLDNVPSYEHQFKTAVNHVEPTSEQYSFQHVRLFSLHNHLYGDPWQPNDVYYFNDEGILTCNKWNSVSRRFESSEVWSEAEILGVCPKHEPGDYNYSLSLECKDKIFILDGRKDGTLSISDTDDRSVRSHAADTWSKKGVKVTSMPAGILMSASCVTDEGPDPIYHVLVQSVVEACTVQELETVSRDPGQTFATLLQWVTIGKPSAEEKFSITSKRDICVHGPVDYATFETDARAVYIASQKKAFFASDSCRPVTPVMERALRKPVRYLWEQTDTELVMRLSLPWLLKDNDLEVTVQDQLLTVSVDVEGKPHSIVSGLTSKRLNQDDASVQCSIQDGRVEIRLLKEVEGEKWDDFIPGDTNGQAAVDPELVRQANETLQQFTSDKLEEGEVVPGFNCAQLEECDAAPADTARLVRLSTNTHAPTHRVALSAHQWICSARLTPGLPPGLVLRHDVDAIAWQPGAAKKSTWDMKHINTFNAFGYVQASKENKKFIVCPPDLGYVAICESSQHVYIYHQPSPLSTELRNRNTGKKVDSVARQQVVKTPSSLTQVLGAYANNYFLFLLFKNAIFTLAIN